VGGTLLREKKRFPESVEPKPENAQHRNTGRAEKKEKTVLQSPTKRGRAKKRENKGEQENSV